MKKGVIFWIILIFVGSMNVWSMEEAKNLSVPNLANELNATSSHRQMMPSHGGRKRMATGIEGKRLTFGFNLGGGVSMLDASSREKTIFGAKFNIFIYGLIPNTKTFAIGFEGGAIVLFANQEKFRNSLESTSRNRKLSEDQTPMGSVGNWILPTAQISFMGNFHPIQRFNVQVKANFGGVCALVPRYNADYSIIETNSEGSKQTSHYQYRYQEGIQPGFSTTLGAKMLYALNACSEIGFGLDWTYMRFQYTKIQMHPADVKGKPVKTSVVSQFGFLDLHIGFAFNF
jgi:hypothetical protein